MHRLSALVLPLALVSLVGGLTLWVVSLHAISASATPTLGLAADFPPSWYLALAFVTAGAVATIHWNGAPPLLISALVAAVVVVLYGTIPAIEQAPEYAWTYKHLGVTHLLMLRGQATPSVDIYNRWPGMFAAAAAFGKLTGTDPLAYAGWFEPVFTLVDAFLLAAIVKSLFGSTRMAALSALIWVLIDWVGQSYYSPQGVSFTLDLVVVLVMLSMLPAGEPWPKVTRAALRRLVGSDGRDVARVELPWGTAAKCIVVLALSASIVPTHELTPYMAVVQAGVLTLLGLRPRWLWAAVLAMAIAYLLPNLSFVTSHYGIFDGLNFAANARVAPTVPLNAPWISAHSGRFLTLLAVLAAGVSVASRARRREMSRVLPLIGLAIAPVALLFGSSYGGEGVLRVLLFASPWMATLIAYGLSNLAPVKRVVLSGLAVTAFAGVFLVAFAAYIPTNLLPADEVQAANWFYLHAPAKSVLVLAGEDFPTNVSWRYSLIVGNPGYAAPDLLANPRLRQHSLGPRDLPLVIRQIAGYSSSGFIVFSTTQDEFARYFRTGPPGTLESLEQAVSSSSRFTLWYRSADVRIYRLRLAANHNAPRA